MKKSKYFPSLEDFIEKSRKGNIIPVYTEILADTETPVSAFKKIDQGGDSFLFESVEGGEKWGRYSFLGTDPRATILSKGTAVAITVGEEVTTLEGDPIEIIRAAISSYKPVEVEGAPKFSGGAIGYIGYDAIRHIEELPELAEDDLNVPDIFLVITDTMLVFDNMEHKMTVVANVFVEGDADLVEASLVEAYDEGVAKIEAMVSLLREAKPNKPKPSAKSSAKPGAGKVTSTFAEPDFLAAVEKTKEYIRSGDIIQAVISQRFSAPLTGDPDPFDIYRALRIINPSPYMFFLRLAGIVLAGSSPEILVGNDGRDICVRPIAGTRPRGKTDAEDKRLEAELLADPKERAEHIMLVDLGRNDVGRVAETGSVEVDELMVIERYSHVMHIVSNVKGRLKKGKDSFDALRACFPAGTLTGAPKVRAMEIIEEMEPVRRAVYGGSVGYISFSGNMDMCITIRTILVKDNVAYVQAGAGIVADSDPEREFEETENKAKGMLKAIEMAIDGLE